MKRRITVGIGAPCEIVGTLLFEDKRGRESAAFKYDPQWLDNPNTFQISPDLPLVPNWLNFFGDPEDVLPGAIADAAPDDWGISVITKSLSRRPNTVEILLEACDETRTGALRFIEESGEIVSQSPNAVPRLRQLAHLRRLNIELDAEKSLGAEIARELRGSGDSLGGVRPKSTIDDNGVLAVAKYTTQRDSLPKEKVEVATLQLARDAGVRASEARLELMDTPLPVAIIRRFDRIGTSRIQYMSARTAVQIKGRDPGYYTDVVDVMRSICGNGPSTLREIRELYTQMIYTILVSNSDNHLKNLGFLYTGDNAWKLAPAFDVNPEIFRSGILKTGISPISGFVDSIEEALEASSFFEIKIDDARKIITEMAEIVKSRWRHHFRALNMSEDECDLFAPAFEHAEMERALSLA